MQFNDLKAQYKLLQNHIDQAIKKVLLDGQFIMGEEVPIFEKNLAEYTGRKHCISCANGTDALQLAFMAYGIGAGDAVFCPDVTFVASVEPACMLGAVPIFCDVNKDTFNICPLSLESQIKAVIKEGRFKPRAVVAVDFLGNPPDYHEISAICLKYDLILIEDAAQSMGASYKGKKCGSFGHIATTSFFPSKPLGCYGDGGAIFTDHDEIAEVLRSLRVHGKGPLGKYDNIRIGVNSRLDTLQAAILIEKLKALPNEITLRQAVANRYNEMLGGRFIAPKITSNSISAYAQYALIAANTHERDTVVSQLQAGNIPCMIYYPTPMHLLPVFKGLNTYEEEFLNSVRYCQRTFSVPMGPYLGPEEQNGVIAALTNEG